MTFADMLAAARARDGLNVDAMHQYFIEQSQIRQQFGVTDCVTFVTGALLAGWGRDFRSALRYKSRCSAVKRLRKAGGLKAAVSDVLGDMHSVDELPMGSVIYFNKPATLGIMMGPYIAVKVGRVIHRLEIESQQQGWRTDGR